MKRNTVLMAIGLSLAATALAKPRQSGIRGLNANGPAHEYADKMMLFGQFVGDWEFDLVSIRPDGTRLKGSGEWHFGWALQGRAIQDVWIARDDVSKGDAPISEWGTTLRFYDANKDAWHVVWAGPMRGNLITFTGKKIGDEIVVEVDSVQGPPRVNPSASTPARRGQWIFDRITSNSFHWRAVTSQDKGKTWNMEQEMFVHRTAH